MFFIICSNFWLFTSVVSDEPKFTHLETPNRRYGVLKRYISFRAMSQFYSPTDATVIEGRKDQKDLFDCFEFPSNFFWRTSYGVFSSRAFSKNKGYTTNSLYRSDSNRELVFEII